MISEKQFVTLEKIYSESIAEYYCEKGLILSSQLPQGRMHIILGGEFGQLKPVDGHLHRSDGLNSLQSYVIKIPHSQDAWKISSMRNVLRKIFKCFLEQIGWICRMILHLYSIQTVKLNGSIIDLYSNFLGGKATAN